MSENKVWFITGTSSGFGRALAEEVLAKGDRVVATARKPEVLQDLVEKYRETARAVKLDVTNMEDAKSAVREAVKEFGRIDVLVNNAGYALVGATEEVSDEQIKQQFDTNVFGVINVTREALPVLREQKSGHVVNIGSVVGFSAWASLGIYSATKFALEGLSEALAAELAPLGIKTTIVEPGPFDTGGVDRAVFAENLLPEAYPSTAQLPEVFREFSNTAGDPVKAVKIIVEAVESENPPFRLPLGLPAFEAIEAKLEQVKQEISIWRARAIETNFDAVVAA
ncbi:MAG: Short-chain dehydrogenase/reductase SDR? [uncultured Pyrinomonadaceae bacterium]|uniref:Short-chain dehydrogenase/reductase SDR n=1 Tax=uncultured Pyrinomonadaceae bacterium TaxID=2283094 RepID=A0A6J4NP80_9BACT|nr:MAG: Short-chain dehydrogenase/reductase SDR? [uncultured Pyrinomonadaceae bacterium]